MPKAESSSNQVKVVGLDTNKLTDNVADNKLEWLRGQYNVGQEAWLLAYADDGVIWGKFQDNNLMTSGEVFPSISPKLRKETLQEARLFGELAEVRIWREGKEFKAIRVEDANLKASVENDQHFDRDYILWGTQKEGEDKGFSLVVEGRQGLRHAVPLNLGEESFKGTNKHPLRLRVRHYIDYDQDGKAYVKLSRLVKLWVKEGGQNES